MPVNMPSNQYVDNYNIYIVQYKSTKAKTTNSLNVLLTILNILFLYQYQQISAYIF